MTPEEELLYFNGINGSTGGYLKKPMKPQDITELIKRRGEEDNIDELKGRRDMLENPSAGVIEDVHATDLSSSGWGVIFAFQDRERVPAIKDALRPLLDWRREQAAAKKERLYREYAAHEELGWEGYCTGESYTDFLKRQGMGPGPANPSKVPYYLLLVGDPEAIPYSFQYQLDVQYAVGRIHFDTLDEYAAYAQSVVAVEKGQVRLPRRAAFFGVQNPADRATQLSATQMIKPLSESLDGYIPPAESQTEANQWRTEVWLAGQASKAQLGRLFGQDTPTFLFTASHGMGFDLGDSKQRPHQGALLCSDWPGVEEAPIPTPQMYFSADDVESDAHLAGLLSFFFACYGAGTPRMDEFSSSEPEPIAPKAFIARLPQRLLSHPKGGALAVVGHVERAWGYSFLWQEAGRQLEVFESAIKRLWKGEPVGWAMEYFNNRYAELSSELSAKLERLRFSAGGRVNHSSLAGMWVANNDARSYVIIGDPAVRLPIVAGDQSPTERPVVQVKALSQAAKPDKPSARDEQPAPAAADKAQSQPAAQALASAPAPEGQASQVEYGLFDSSAVKSLGSSLQQFADKLSDALKTAIENTSSLNVSTYTSDDMTQVKFEGGKFTGARLRALTHIGLDGDTKVCVPVGRGGG